MCSHYLTGGWTLLRISLFTSKESKIHFSLHCQSLHYISALSTKCNPILVLQFSYESKSMNMPQSSKIPGKIADHIFTDKLSLQYVQSQFCKHKNSKKMSFFLSFFHSFVVPFWQILTYDRGCDKLTQVQQFIGFSSQGKTSLFSIDQGISCPRDNVYNYIGHIPPFITYNSS